jgi:hypothetical protein
MKGGKRGCTKYGSVVVRRKKDQVMWRKRGSSIESDDKWAGIVHALNATRDDSSLVVHT